MVVCVDPVRPQAYVLSIQSNQKKKYNNGWASA